MRLTAEDRNHFSGDMNRLADHFNRTAAKWIREEKPFTAARKKSMETRRARADALFDAFSDKGYTRRQWNNLLESSGAADRMGVYGGAYRMLTDRQFDAILRGAKKTALP
ncbi:MAG: hypothetical protein ACAH80_01100 [Alphaproteobacteria bacterium]